MGKKLLTPAEAAQLKGVSRSTIYSAIAEGRLKHTRVLGRLALQEVDVKAWTPIRYGGRPSGIPMSQEARDRISEAQKRRWKRRKQNSTS